MGLETMAVDKNRLTGEWFSWAEATTLLAVEFTARQTEFLVSELMENFAIVIQPNLSLNIEIRKLKSIVEVIGHKSTKEEYRNSFI